LTTPSAVVKKSHKRRNILIVIGVLILVLLIIGISFSEQPPVGTPNQIGAFSITGDRTKGFTAFFWMKDIQQTNVVSAGTVFLTIYDNRNNTVYANTFQLSSSDFGKYRYVLTGGTVWGYQWSIDPSQVKPSVADVLGVNVGSAKLTFTTATGLSLSAIDAFVNLASA